MSNSKQTKMFFVDAFASFQTRVSQPFTCDAPQMKKRYVRVPHLAK